MRLATLLAPDLREILRDDPTQVRGLLEEIHAEDLADLFGELTPEEAAKLLEQLPAEEAAPIFERLDEHEQEDIAQLMAAESIAQIASEMEPDDRADLFSALPDAVGAISSSRRSPGSTPRPPRMSARSRSGRRRAPVTS